MPVIKRLRKSYSIKNIPFCFAGLKEQYVCIYVFVFSASQEKLMTSSYSPVLTAKAVKDETEQRILRDAHVCLLHTIAPTDTHITE